MISISTIWRIGLCALSGLSDTPLLLTALMLLPAAWLGMKLGEQADKHLAKALHGLLIVSGLSLIGKGLY